MQIHYIPKSAVIVLSGLVLLASGASYADDDHAEDSDAVKYRHAVMQAMGSHFAAIAMVFTGRIDRPDDLQVHAEALAQTATTIGGLFPPGSEGGEALAIIWEEPDKVAEATRQVAETTAALAEALTGGDQGKAAKAFKTASDSCKGCHERYKEEEEEDH